MGKMMGPSLKKAAMMKGRGMMKGHSAAHPGFQAVQSDIADEDNPNTGKPYGPKVAGAILASRSRGASAAAKRANPRLKRV